VGRCDSSLRAASSMMMSSSPHTFGGIEDQPTAASKLAADLKRSINRSRQSSPDMSTLSTRASCTTSSSPMSALAGTPRVGEDFCMPGEEVRTPTRKQPITSSEWLSNAGASPKSSVSQAGIRLCAEVPPSQQRERLRFQTPEVGGGSKENYTPLAQRRLGRAKDMSKLTIQTQPVKDIMKKQIRKLEEDEKIFDVYYWEEVLQECGDGGKVVICEPKDGGKTPKVKKGRFRYVMKMRSKKDLEAHGLLRDFRKLQERLLNMPPHSNVLVPHEVLEDESFYYIVMEKALHACFFSGLLSLFGDGVMPASAIRRLMEEILGAVNHVHREGMLHRDIKPDNLVVHEDLKSPTGKKVMLIDFDHADPEYGPHSPKFQDACFGTVRYNAPECFQGRFSVQSDLYGVGCILYLLVTGKMPYDDDVFEFESDTRSGKHNHAIFKRLQQATIDFTCNPFPEEVLCRDFCKSLLAFNPEDRPPSAAEALNHPWFKQQAAGAPKN